MNIFYSLDQSRDFAFLSTSLVGRRPELSKHLSKLPNAILRDIAQRVRLLPPPSSSSSPAVVQAPSREFVLEVLLNHFAEKESRVTQISKMPLYPDETLLWGDLTPPKPAPAPAPGATSTLSAAANAAATAGAMMEEDGEESPSSSSSFSSSHKMKEQQKSSSSSSLALGSWQRQKHRPMALPKLNLQFLSFHDYLLR